MADSSDLRYSLNTRLTVHRGKTSYEIYNVTGSEHNDPSFLVFSQRMSTRNAEGRPLECPKDPGTPPYLDPKQDRRTLQINVERSVEYRTESDIFVESAKK